MGIFFTKSISFLLLSVTALSVSAQQAKATAVVNADQGTYTIGKHIYGQFAEHLGHGIYGGLWVGENSPIPNTHSVRNDVIAAFKSTEICR